MSSGLLWRLNGCARYFTFAPSHQLSCCLHCDLRLGRLTCTDCSNRTVCGLLSVGLKHQQEVGWSGEKEWWYLFVWFFYSRPQFGNGYILNPEATCPVWWLFLTRYQEPLPTLELKAERQQALPLWSAPEGFVIRCWVFFLHNNKAINSPFIKLSSTTHFAFVSHQDSDWHNALIYKTLIYNAWHIGNFTELIMAIIVVLVVMSIQAEKRN